MKYKLTSLVITKIFCQSLSPRYIEVALYLILFIYFPKSGGGGAATSAPPPEA